MGRPIGITDPLLMRAQILLRHHRGNQEHAREALGVSKISWQRIMDAIKNLPEPIAPDDTAPESATPPRPVSDEVVVLLRRTADLATQLGQLINAVTVLVYKDQGGVSGSWADGGAS